MVVPPGSPGGGSGRGPAARPSQGPALHAEDADSAGEDVVTLGEPFAAGQHAGTSGNDAEDAELSAGDVVPSGDSAEASAAGGTGFNGGGSAQQPTQPQQSQPQPQSQAAMSGPEQKQPGQEQASMDQVQKPKEATPAYASRSSGSLTPFQALLKGELGLIRGQSDAPPGPTPTSTPAAGAGPGVTPSPVGQPNSTPPAMTPVPRMIPMSPSSAGPLAGIPSSAISLIPGGGGALMPGMNGGAAASLVSPVSVNLRSFNLFASRVRPEIRAQHPEYGGPETERAIGMRWNAMGATEREEFLELARKERESMVAQGLIDPNIRPRRKRRKRAEIEAEALMKQASLGRWMRSAAAAAAAASGGGAASAPFGLVTPWMPAGASLPGGGVSNGGDQSGAPLGVMMPGGMGDQDAEGDGLGGEGREGKEGGGGGMLVGQGVHGVLDGSFDAGFFVTLRVAGSATVLRGVVFAPGSSIPVTMGNDVAPGVPRAEPDGLGVHSTFAGDLLAHSDPSAAGHGDGSAPLSLPGHSQQLTGQGQAPLGSGRSPEEQAKEAARSGMGGEHVGPMGYSLPQGGGLPLEHQGMGMGEQGHGQHAGEMGDAGMGYAQGGMKSGLHHDLVPQQRGGGMDVLGDHGMLNVPTSSDAGVAAPGSHGQPGIEIS